MGINVSHGSNQWGEERRSALTIANLGKHLAHVLPTRDWRQIAHLFDGSFADAALIDPADAARFADILDRAAGHRLMHPYWVDEVRLFAAAARRASSAGQPWQWS